MDPNTAFQQVAEVESSAYFVNHDVFTTNFEMLWSKILFYGRTRRPTVIMKIAEFLGNARTDRLVSTAFLCYFTEEEACRDGQDKALIAFQHLFHLVPAEEEIAAYLGGETTVGQLYPQLLIQCLGETPSYFIVHNDAVVDISRLCSDAGYAAYTLFLYYVHNAISFPHQLAFFFDFMYFFLVELPPRQGFMRPSDTSSSVFETLKRATARHLFKQLNL